MKKLTPSGLLVLGLCLLALTGLSCNQEKKPSSQSGEKAKVEGDLVFITLAENEVASLQIATTKVEKHPVKEHLELTGWVMAKQGREVALTAPVAGVVLEPPGKYFAANPRLAATFAGLAATPARQRSLLAAAVLCPTTTYDPPIPGHPVRANQLLFRMRPVLSPLERIQLAALKRSFEMDLVKAEVTLKQAETQRDRIAPLVKAGTRSQQDLDDIVLRVDHALEDHRSALDKLDAIEHLALIDITAPRAGQVAIVHVSPGQYVPAAAPLVTLIDLDTVWVRVPVPEHDLQQVHRAGKATVVLRAPRADVEKNAGVNERTFEATLASEAPLVDATRHTVDFIYEIPPKGAKHGHFARDLMVTALVPVSTGQPETAVPYAAIVYDAHGGAWVYVDRGKAKSGKQQYERRGVNVGARVHGTDLVVVRPSLTAGEAVVTSGAGILFSREFYKPPVNP
jgi:RND family efflux transporter MFP subunit